MRTLTLILVVGHVLSCNTLRSTNDDSGSNDRNNGSVNGQQASLPGQDQPSVKPTGKFAEIEQKKALFTGQTQVQLTCAKVGPDDCIRALNALLEIAKSDIFPTTKFDVVAVQEKFMPVSSVGFVGIDAKATAEQVSTHLRSVSDDYTKINRAKTTFLSVTGTKTTCATVNPPQCIEGLEKLLTLKSSPIFSARNFDVIAMAERFGGVDSVGFVTIDVHASATEIEGHLRKQ